MKKILIIIGTLLLLLLGFLIVSRFFGHTPVSSPPPVQGNPNSFPNITPTPSATPTSNPTPQGSGATMQVRSQTGGTFTVYDFIHNGETAADIENPGNYFLAGSLGYCIANVGCPSGATTTDFQLTYTANDQAFHIVLLAEPLSIARHEAEQFLASRLGINAAQMCNLYYYVETTFSVSPIYANKNLGFSFCPGAVALP